MKRFRIFIAMMLLGMTSIGVYMLSNWANDVPTVVVSEVSAAPLEKIKTLDEGKTMPVLDLGDCPFQVNETCYTCASPEAFAVDSAAECAKCPNRKAIYTGGQEIEAWACALLTCPDTHPIYAEQGNCFSCDETRAIDFFPENGDIGANKCPNRILNDSALVLKQCPSSHPLIDPLGGCYACDEIQDVYTTSENCVDCANRSFEPMSHVGRCYIK
ncbi:MAG: hypothetical protein IKV03_02870 [Alphaproteobacteria bacterium]|nr:hypothetical protein [Alphaproteobacteria bacterium]